jgi:glycosyltransferase involved in cell wall biosynthesis
MRDPIVIFAEPLLHTQFSQFSLVGALAGGLNDDFEVTVASPAIGAEVRTVLEARGIGTISGDFWYPLNRSVRAEPPAFVESWFRDAIFGSNRRRLEERLNGRDLLRLNFSMTSSVRSDLWYIQSQPLPVSVRAILPNLTTPLRITAALGLPVVDLLDARHFRATVDGSGKLYTSTRYVASFYERQGYRVSGQIPPFLFPTSFAPTTANPHRDYALVYLGKETDTQAVRDLIEIGFPIQLFGGKSAQWVRSALGGKLPSHVTTCGYVSHEELRVLYTNALFTAFPFTDESFGLVPVESMACGTPVLTYASQGPGETVVDGFTGWLAEGRRQFVEASRRLFDRGYPAGIQSACVERAEWFSLANVSSMWKETIRSLLDGRDHRPPTALPLPLAQPNREGLLSMRELVGRLS